MNNPNFQQATSASADARLADLALGELMRKLVPSVVVITAQNGEERTGLTATAMCSLSASPESILVCINKSASAAPQVLQIKYFAVNEPAQQQEEVAGPFSTHKLPIKEQFAGANRFELSHSDGRYQTLAAPALEA
jgi:flavin reductase (DIM6/NTAB) family NADH-FMN oxidoreductase RutF